MDADSRAIRAAEIRIRASLTHEEMAQMIGSSRETVTRLLSDLKKKEFIRLDGIDAGDPQSNGVGSAGCIVTDAAASRRPGSPPRPSTFLRLILLKMESDLRGERARRDVVRAAEGGKKVVERVTCWPD